MGSREGSCTSLVKMRDVMLLMSADLGALPFEVRTVEL